MAFTFALASRAAHWPGLYRRAAPHPRQLRISPTRSYCRPRLELRRHPPLHYSFLQRFFFAAATSLFAVASTSDSFAPAFESFSAAALARFATSSCTLAGDSALLQADSVSRPAAVSVSKKRVFIIRLPHVVDSARPSEWGSDAPRDGSKRHAQARVLRSFLPQSYTPPNTGTLSCGPPE